MLCSYHVENWRHTNNRWGKTYTSLLVLLSRTQTYIEKHMYNTERNILQLVELLQAYIQLYNKIEMQHGQGKGISNARHTRHESINTGRNWSENEMRINGHQCPKDARKWTGPICRKNKFIMNLKKLFETLRIRPGSFRWKWFYHLI